MYTGPSIVTDGMVLSLDAANTKSYVSGSTVWRDMSGNEYSGSLINGPTFSNVNGGSIVFDGVDDYALGNSVPALNCFPITIMGWVSFSGSGDFVNKYTSGTLNGYRIGLSNNNGISL
jgi:hypothetical protein